MSVLNLQEVNPMFHEQAREAFEAGNASGFVHSTDNHKGLELVFDNVFALRERGIYEAALLDAFTSTNTNNHHWQPGIIEWLFKMADRAKLLAAGDPLPDGNTFTVYRGVAGVGRARRITTGYSWTLSRESACWFACRLSFLPNPAVYKATIARDDVLAYHAGRSEDEIICRPPRPKRLKLSADELQAGQAEVAAILRASLDDFLANAN